MIPRSKSSPLAGENIFGGGMKTKKKAPPRPPQPSHDKLQGSQSFRRSSDISGFRLPQQSSNDLIDFNAPPSAVSSNIVSNNINNQTNQPKEFMYRVGASIFYVRSPLKNSSIENTNQQMPFSPPRPSPQSLLMSSPMKVNSNAAKPAVPPPLNPTIIRPGGGNAGVQGNGIGSGTNLNNNSWQNNQGSAQTKNSNVPLVWDEPPKKLPPPLAPKPATSPKPPTAPKPTIIRPTNAAPALPVITPTVLKAALNKPAKEPEPSRNYYDEPPDDYEDTGDDEPSFSPPMPNEPPPPPPPELENDWDTEWDEGSNGTSVANSEDKFSDVQVGDGDRAYALVLYDYVPEQEGDLQLMAGDVVYLIKVIDDNWIYGSVDGAEGMFPSNHVNIVVPLPPAPEEVAESNFENAESNFENAEPVDLNVSQGSESKGGYFFTEVLYTFNAETDGDLQLEAGERVAVWGRINDDWLYGSYNRKQGQFPANFVGPVPEDLPILNF